MRAKIMLVPVGPVSADLLSWLAEQIEQVFRQAVVVGGAVPLPIAGYDPRRRQYRGDAFIAALRAILDPAVERVLGLTDVDCYAPGLNFIFGQATWGGREAFVALPRLRQSFYDLPEDSRLFRQRALTEVVHELGHTWNLSHCPDRRCVMHFSNTLHDTDIKGNEFCSRCWERLKQAG